MRWTARIALIVVLLAPAAGVAGNNPQNPAVCVHLAHQLVHFDRAKQRAAQIGNHAWVARFKAHIAKLEDDHARHCPDQAAANKTAQQLRDLLLAAARGALTFLTLGMF